MLIIDFVGINYQYVPGNIAKMIYAYIFVIIVPIGIERIVRFWIFTKKIDTYIQWVHNWGNF